jgi:D-alanyl-D-alanine carboxypeptidase/D-alanyl-D-alanine-endopeptidase (penicillin-binding protein 4)
MRWIIGLIFLALQLEGAEKLPERIGKIMAMDKYKHSTWGLYVKDSETGNVLYDYQSDQLFMPGSTTKIFTVSAWSHAYGDDFRFKTPVYTAGSVHEGILEGSLILVGRKAESRK